MAPRPTLVIYDAIPSRKQIPSAYAPHWRHAGRAWQRDARMLVLMAETGWSCRLSLSAELIRYDDALTSVRAGSIQRLWNRLQERGLIRQRTIVLEPRRHATVSLVELTPYGRELLYQMGIPTRSVAEWQVLRQHHDADGQLRHTAMVVLAAHYFRQRGFKTACCPLLSGPYLPDLQLVHQETGKCLYIEVETPSSGGRFHKVRLLRKLEMQMAEQGHVAFCTLNPYQRHRMVDMASAVFRQGMGTDLLTLHQQPDIVWASVWSPIEPSLADRFGATVRLSVGTGNVANASSSEGSEINESP